jgi:putative thioredoxin
MAAHRTARIRDVDEASFTEVVLEGSATRPVVVDFWAAWCAPCRQLAPLLEAAAERWAGEVDVVKVDVDANPRLAQAMRIQGIPAVKAFAGGRVVAELTGLQPAAVVEQLFAAVAPSPADRLVAAAQGDPDGAEGRYREALAIEPDHPGAALGLAGLRAAEGDPAGALEVLARARPTGEVQQRIAALRLAAEGDGELGELRARADSGDDAARVPLGRALAAAGRHDEAIEVLLAAVAVPALREEARTALLEVFTVLGADDPRVRAARPRLAAALF